MTRTRTLWTKLIFSILLAVAALSVTIALPAQAHADPSEFEVYTVGDAVYRPVNNGGDWHAVVTGCKGSSSITVPKEVKIEGVTMPVTAFFPGALRDKDKMKTLTINAEIEYIPLCLCTGCSSLKKVVLPSTVNKIGDFAFSSCESLSSISPLPNVTALGKYAFKDCSSLSSVLTESLTSIGEGAFSECTSLERLANDQDELANGGLKRISPYAFYRCEKLKYIGIPLEVQQVGDYAFYGCNSLSALHFRDLTSIGNNAFQNCKNVQTANLGGVVTIGDRAFQNCEALIVVALGSKVESIGEGAFRDCASLEKMNLPASLRQLGVAAFMNCTSLTELTFPSPGNLKSIPSNLCKGCKLLTYVRIPLSITGTIGSDAFENSQLRQAFIMSKDVTFNGNPFKGCNNFTLVGYTGSTAEAHWNEHKSEFGWLALDGDDIAKVTVSFGKGQSDAYGDMSSVTVAGHGDLVLPECEFNWEGHEFTGWKIGTRLFPPGHVVQDIMKNFDCVANWSQASIVTLKGPAGDIVETCSLGSSYTIPENPFVYDGKIFKCWYKEGDEATEYLPGDTINSLPLNLTLCAKFVTQAKVTLDPMGGTFADGTKTNKTMSTNKYGTLSDFPEVSKDGYEFGGWQLVYSPPGDPSHPQIIVIDPDNPESFVQYSTVQAGERVVTLRALWVNDPPHYIILDPNGGIIDGNMKYLLLETDNTGFLSDNAIVAHQATREHYTFDAWMLLNKDRIMPGYYHRYNHDTVVIAAWKPIAVSKITLSAENVSLITGNELTLSAEVTPSDALDTSVKWSSSNSSVATISSTGTIKAVAPGTTTITCASTDGGANAACTVTVTSGLAADGTKVGTGADASVAETFLTSYEKETCPAGSTFGNLRFKMSKAEKTSITLAWKKVSGAKEYVVYGAACGKFKLSKVATLSAGKTSYTWKKLLGKKLSKGKYYKSILVAIDANGKVLSTSKMVHAATAGGKVGNYKKVTTSAKKNKVKLTKGKTFKLKGKAVAASAKKKVQDHRAVVLYESSDKKVATVSSKGVVKGKKAGTCYVYAYAEDGVFAKVKVAVKAPSQVTTTSTSDVKALNSAGNSTPLRSAS